jgi:hypothetical protein
MTFTRCHTSPRWTVDAMTTGRSPSRITLRMAPRSLAGAVTQPGHEVLGGTPVGWIRYSSVGPAKYRISYAVDQTHAGTKRSVNNCWASAPSRPVRGDRRRSASRVRVRIP